MYSLQPSNLCIELHLSVLYSGAMLSVLHHLSVIHVEGKLNLARLSDNHVHRIPDTTQGQSDGHHFSKPSFAVPGVTNQRLLS